jgi:hypothetical protein
MAHEGVDAHAVQLRKAAHGRSRHLGAVKAIIRWDAC